MSPQCSLKEHYTTRLLRRDREQQGVRLQQRYYVQDAKREEEERGEETLSLHIATEVPYGQSKQQRGEGWAGMGAGAAGQAEEGRQQAAQGAQRQEQAEGEGGLPERRGRGQKFACQVQMVKDCAQEQ